MKVILLEDIKGVGKKDDIKEVSEGYAKNFLLPHKKAVLADKNNLTKMKNIQKIEEEQKRQEYEDALSLAKKIESKNLIIKAKLGENGKLFGTVTNKEIAEELKKQEGINIEKKKIIIQNPIKMLGQREVKIKLHPKVSATLNITIQELK